MRTKDRVLLTSLAGAVALDQLTKLLVVSRLVEGERLPVVEGFLYLTHLRNPAAAFGLLGFVPESWRVASFVAISIAAAAVVFSYFRRLAPGERRIAFALALVLGGAVGNLVDRVARGGVVDFLHVRLWGGYRWPDFNLADVFIVVGVSALIFDLLAAEGASRAGAAEAKDKR